MENLNFETSALLQIFASADLVVSSLLPTFNLQSSTYSSPPFSSPRFRSPCCSSSFCPSSLSLLIHSLQILLTSCAPSHHAPLHFCHRCLGRFNYIRFASSGLSLGSQQEFSSRGHIPTSPQQPRCGWCRVGSNAQSQYPCSSINLSQLSNRTHSVTVMISIHSLPTSKTGAQFATTVASTLLPPALSEW